MRIAGTSHIVKLMQAAPSCREALEAWHAELRHGTWEDLGALLRDYPQAVKQGEKILFRFPGNCFAEVQFNFANGWAYIHSAGAEKPINAREK